VTLLPGESSLAKKLVIFFGRDLLTCLSLIDPMADTHLTLWCCCGLGLQPDRPL